MPMRVFFRAELFRRDAADECAEDGAPECHADGEAVDAIAESPEGLDGFFCAGDDYGIESEK